VKKIKLSILTIFFALITTAAFAQSVSFALKTSPNVNLTFDSIEKYKNGIIVPNFLNLKVEAVATEWDLYVGTTTVTNGIFDTNYSYGTSGNPSVPVSVLQARVSNTSNTSQTGNTFFNLTDISNPVHLIGSNANDPTINCGSTGTNAPGSYTTQPQCYNFRVDLKANPGFDYKAGSYSLRIDFILIQDL
jgi:hypothetical protein